MKIIPLVAILFINISTNAKNTDIDSIIDYYNNCAFDYLEIGVLDSAVFYLLKTANLQESLTHSKEETAKTYINLGVLYRKLNNYRKALKYLNLAEDYYTKYDPNSSYVAYIYNNKGNVYYNYADYSEAERYYRYTLRYYESSGYKDKYVLGTISINIYNSLIAQGKVKESIGFLNQIGKYSFEDESAFHRYYYLAESYLNTGAIDSALISADRAIKVYDEEIAPNISYHIAFNNLMGSIYISMNKLDEASNYLMDNIYYVADNKTRIGYEDLIKTHILIGYIYYKKSDYFGAYKYLERVIESIPIEEYLDSPTDNLLKERSITTDIIDLYRLSGLALKSLYDSNGSLKNLEAALNSYEKCIQYIKVFRIHMRNEESIHQETGSRMSIFHEAIDVANKLFLVKNEYKYLEEAFIIAENIKSFSLYTEINSVEAISFADLPVEIKEQEQLLTREINAYEELLYEERKKENIDLDLIHNLETKLFKLKDENNNLIDSIENNYPHYFELKYNPHFITPKEIQAKIGKQEALVEYVLADTILTIFVIDKEEINVLNRPIPRNFRQDCLDYFDLLQNQDFSNDVHNTYRNYVNYSRMFYKTLIEPVLEVTESKEITFVPDGEIMYLPFEAFLTEDVDREYIDYRNLPYLIHDISVGYSYSSTLLFNERIKTGTPKDKVLAFAPNYENLLDKNPLMWNRQSNPEMLIPLEGAREEVEYISRRVPSVALMDSMASEKNFKKYASDYSILHLAMHTIMNDEDPMYSRLAFTRNFSDTTEDHDLFTYEIYNMKLNADMVVLSSCSSGFGKMQKGEGMMSLARGFMYAGCPSIIMTLWQVSDHSSSELMSYFYKYLNRGETKKEALRKAKMEYINSSDNLRSNPYFWSAFLVVGDNAPVFKSSRWTVAAVAGVLLLTIALYIFYRKRVIRGIKGTK